MIQWITIRRRGQVSVYHTSDRPPFLEGQCGWVQSKLLVCPMCQELWCSVLIGPTQPAEAITVVCEDCPYHTEGLYSKVHGSILPASWAPWLVDYEMLDYLPPELIERELNLTLKAVS